MKLDSENHQSTIAHLEQKLSETEFHCSELINKNNKIQESIEKIQNDFEEKINILS